MLSFETAKKYNEQMHPAFAGLIHDGKVSQEDVLGEIFKLILNGNLILHFEENSLTKRIVSVSISNKKPKLEFEELLIKYIFEGSEELSSLKIGERLKDKAIQDFLRYKIRKTLDINIDDREFYQRDSSQGIRYNIYDYKLSRSSYIVLMFILGIASIISIFLFDSKASWFTISIFVLCLFGFVDILKYKRNRIYSFKGQNINELRTKYNDLYEFLKQSPLQPHTLTNEFLPFSIAFRLDKSWYKDFGLKDKG